MSQLFSNDEWHRYTRHIQLPQIGASGQTQLKQSHVLIIGAGGLGSPVSLYLAAAGVGNITIVDGDTVELTNLQRQILFTTQDIGDSKAEIAKTKLMALNPEINVEAVNAPFTFENAADLVGPVDLVLDCTDNFETRYCLNDTCVSLKKPWVFASIFQFSGQCALFTPETACFRCVFPSAPSQALDCNAAGVLGVLPGLLGTIQATEAIKYLVGLPSALKNQLLLVETIELSMRKIQLLINPQCSCCQQATASKAAEENQPTCQVELDQHSVDGITSEQLQAYLDDTSTILLDVRTEAERNAFNIGGIHIPLDELESKASELLTNDQPLLVYCQSGSRSANACRWLTEHNYFCKNLTGGLAAWVKFNSRL